MKHNISQFFLDDNGEIKRCCFNLEKEKIILSYIFYAFEEVGELYIHDKSLLYSEFVGAISVTNRKGFYQSYHTANNEISKEEFFCKMKDNYPAIFEWLIWNI